MALYLIQWTTSISTLADFLFGLNHVILSVSFDSEISTGATATCLGGVMMNSMVVLVMGCANGRTDDYDQTGGTDDDSPLPLPASRLAPSPLLYPHPHPYLTTFPFPLYAPLIPIQLPSRSTYDVI